MDFDHTDEQAAVERAGRPAARRPVDPERLRTVEHGNDPDRFDRELWSALAEAGLLACSCPPSQGGAGLGVIEACILLREAGRRTAAVPALATVAMGALPLARWGSPAQQAALLPGVADGTRVVTAALAGPHGDPREPSASARRDGADWTLDGELTNVTAGTLASHALVPATTRELGDRGSRAPGRRRRVGDPPGHHDGHTRSPRQPVRRQTSPTAHSSRATGPRDVLHGPDRIAGRRQRRSCAEMAGVCAEAVAITGRYTTERQQFGRPIASFQAVTQRAGDAYVDAQGVELTMLQAAWRLGAGLDAGREVAVAKFWAAAGGPRVVHAAQHLHGGMGVDRDYPLHRYFLRAKQLELFLGGATRQLLRLGRLLAAEGATR